MAQKREHGRASGLSVNEVRRVMRKSGSFTDSQIEAITEESLKNIRRVKATSVKPSRPWTNLGERVFPPRANEVVRIHVGTDVEIDEKKNICRWTGPGCKKRHFWC